jgi:pyruvate/oxaloacetate carboxyltransferase
VSDQAAAEKVDREMVDAVAAMIRKHVRLEWHGHDHADINYRSTVEAAEEIVRQIDLAIQSIRCGA